MKSVPNSTGKSFVRSKKTILLLIAIIAATVVLTTFISILLERISTIHVPSMGTIHTIGVEAFDGDIRLQNGSQYVDWGTIYPGTSTNRTFSLRSKSNVETILSLKTTNWSPINMSVYLTLSWNYSGAPMGPDEVTRVTLSLLSSDSQSFIDYLVTNDVEEFSFDIIISAEQY